MIFLLLAAAILIIGLAICELHELGFFSRERKVVRAEDRRDKANPPAPNMIWSDKYMMWMDVDDRTPERKAQDEAIAAEECRKNGCHKP